MIYILLIELEWYIYIGNVFQFYKVKYVIIKEYSIYFLEFILVK